MNAWQEYFRTRNLDEVRKGAPHRVPALESIAFGLQPLRQYLRQFHPRLSAKQERDPKRWPDGCVAMGPAGIIISRRRDE